MSQITLDPDELPAYQQAKRQQILDAATELLRNQAYDDIEVRDVAKAAGTALSTVYRYFPSKDFLFGSVLAAWAGGFPTPAAGPKTGIAPEPTALTEANIRASMRKAVRAYEQFPQMVRVLMMLESSTDDRTRAVYHEFAGHNVGAIVGSPPGKETSVATAIVDTAYGVMNTKLRAWVFDLVTIQQVDKAVQRCLDLIFSPPPLQ